MLRCVRGRSGLIAFDIHAPAQRATSRLMPSCMEMSGPLIGPCWGNGLKIIRIEVLEVYLWGGFLCVDLSSVNSGQGLEGKQSSLFYEIPRVHDLLYEGFPQHVRIKPVGENVASMKKEECKKISEYLEIHPYHFDGEDAVPMNCASMDGLVFLPGEYLGVSESRSRLPGHFSTDNAWSRVARS